MTVQDVHLLALHEPYRASEHPVPINATIVHALTLLQPTVPQPVGGLMYRCLTEFPGRSPGCVVPLSTLTFELDGGRGWNQIGDWEQVVEVVVKLTRVKRCDAIPLGLAPLAAQLLSQGPNTIHDLHHPDGTRLRVGPAERQEQLDDLTDRVRAFVARGPFWPGGNLVSPPSHPVTMPYKPCSSGPDYLGTKAEAETVRSNNLKRPERNGNVDIDRPGRRSILRWLGRRSRQ